MIIDPLYKFINSHDDLLKFESEQISEALNLLITADYYLAHLGVSHRDAVKIESSIPSGLRSVEGFKVSEGVVIPSFDSDFD